MGHIHPCGRVARFGAFEVDLQSRELRKRGVKLRLQEKPFQILQTLLENAGDVVTREDLHKRLWPDIHVGFNRSLNTAVSTLRHVLGDSADNPRFVETCQRLGYRFIASVERSGGTQASPTDGTLDSIAVLPLNNEAGDPELEYLSDGISECLINTLSRLPGVRVMAWATVFRYRGREVDPLAVGRELNVRAVLTGRVLQRSNSLSVSTEVVDVRTGWQLWGEQFHRKADDLPELQAAMARDIVNRLRPRLPQDQRRVVGQQYSRNAVAHMDYLKGRYCLNKLTEQSLRQGVAHFKQAIQRDPGYAPAYAGLAACLGLFALFGLQRPREVMPAAKEAAVNALTLDEDLAEAHASLAGILKAYDWDWHGAENEYRRALELNPNYATGHHLYADFLSAMGRPGEAIAEIHRAQELDPLSLVISNEVAWNLYMGGRFEEALACAKKTLEMEPGFSPALHTLGLACEQLSRFDEALDALELARRSSAENPASLAALGHAAAAAGRRPEATRILADLQDLSRRRYVSAYQCALIHSGLGDHRSALELLRCAVEERDVWLVWVKREPRFDPLHSDPRFEAILATMKLGRLPTTP